MFLCLSLSAAFLTAYVSCFPGGFYPNPLAYDASAAYMPPPPYSAPLGQQPPHDPDFPSSAAGECKTEAPGYPICARSIRKIPKTLNLS